MARPDGHDLQMIDGDDGAAAVLHPLRRQILEALADPDSASGLSRRLGLPRQKINYHLRELEKQQLVELVEERKRGNCMERVVRATARTYVIGPATLGALAADPARVRDRFSAAYLMALAARLLQDLGILRERSEEEGKRLATLSLQTEVRFRDAAARQAFADELTDAVAGLVARYHDESAEGGRRFRFVIGGHPVPAPHDRPIETDSNPNVH